MEKGILMCRGASEVRREVPLLPVEEQSAEQQAEGVEAAAEIEMAAVAAVASKFLNGRMTMKRGVMVMMRARGRNELGASACSPRC